MKILLFNLLALCAAIALLLWAGFASIHAAPGEADTWSLAFNLGLVIMPIIMLAIVYSLGLLLRRRANG